MSNNFTDVKFEEVKPKIYYTIPQIAEIIGEDEKRTRYWGNEFGEELLVERVSGRRKFSEESIERFKQLKLLVDEHNFSKIQIQKYFKELDEKRGEKYSDYKNATELINPQDPLGMEVLATQLTVKMNEQIEEKLNDFLEKFITYQEEYKKDLIVQITTDVTNDVIDKLQENTNSINSALDNINKVISNTQNDLSRTAKEIIEQQCELISKSQEKFLDGFNVDHLEDDLKATKTEVSNLSSDILKGLEEQNRTQEKLIENLTKQLEKRDTDICNRLKESLDNQKNLQRQVNEKKGLLKRIFG
ncbi:MerR family transcriptional regulator [Clostridium perfringens]